MQITNDPPKVVGTFSPTWDTTVIAMEPMLFSAGLAFAEEHGGPVTRAVLGAIPPQQWADIHTNCRAGGKHVVIDTRVHMLMPGQYPAIPGWHCDSWPRDAGGQPLHLLDPTVEHWVALAGDREGSSHTEYLRNPVEVTYNPAAVWRVVSSEIPPDAKVGQMAFGQIHRFNQSLLHRAQQARRPGWRFFLRLSTYHFPPVNAIRRQVQVYTTTHGGW